MLMILMMMMTRIRMMTVMTMTMMMMMVRGVHKAVFFRDNASRFQMWNRSVGLNATFGAQFAALPSVK